MNETQFINAFITWLRPQAPGLAALIDSRPYKWASAISRVRELCQERGWNDNETQFKAVLVNVFPSKL